VSAGLATPRSIAAASTYPNAVVDERAVVVKPQHTMTAIATMVRIRSASNVNGLHIIAGSRVYGRHCSNLVPLRTYGRHNLHVVHHANGCTPNSVCICAQPLVVKICSAAQCGI
jgi:hypothetical protein